MEDRRRPVRTAVQSRAGWWVLWATLIGWILTGSIQPAQAANGTGLSLPTVSVPPGQQTVVPIVLSLEPGEEVLSADITIGYDSTLVSAVTVEKGSLASDSSWSLQSNLSSAGIIRIALAGSEAATSGGELLRLTFQAGAEQGSSGLTWQRGELNEANLAATLQDGALIVNTDPVAVDDTYAVNEDSVLSVAASGVLVNDSDGDDDALTATLGGIPAHGQLTLNLDGSFTYTPTTDFNGTDVFTYTVADGHGGLASGAVTVTVHAVNDAPVLDNSGTMVLASIEENDTSNSGNTVLEIIASAGGDRITDVDDGAEEGLAIIAANNGNGAWQYSLDGGNNWSDLGSPSPSAARLLAADANARIRFVPATGFSGTVDAGITFRAWDQTSGANGGTADTGNNGGTTAFSVATETASITVSPLFSVSGSVRYWNGSSAVPGALLSLTGVQTYSALTDSGGGYTVADVPAGSYTLAPSKSDGANGISAYDAALVLQHSAAITTLSESAALAADVDQSGTITSMDAHHILQKAVDMIPLPFPNAGVVWEFMPASITYPSLNGDLAVQDFTAVLLGDVSGNWQSQGVQASHLPGAGARLKVDEGAVEAGNILTVTVVLEAGSGQVFSLDLLLGYEADMATPLAVAQTGAMADWLMGANLSVPGRIKVATAAPAPLTGDGPVLAVPFALAGSGSAPSVQVLRAAVNEADEVGGQVGAPESGGVYLPLISVR